MVARHKNPVPESVEQTLAEHKEILALVHELEAHCEEGARSPSESVRANVHDTLERLSDLLSRHFRGEERDFYRDLPSRFPRLSTRCTELVGQHTDIAAYFDLATREAERLAKGNGGSPDSLSVHVHTAISALRNHESEETNLIMEAYWDDIGTGD
jgi:hypothetical protein